MSMLLHYVVPVVHILSCFFLIVVVLLQTGKGADMGAVFGGGSQTLFGSSGAGNFLTRLTTATAILFMLTSLILTYGQTPGSSRLLERLPPAAQVPAPTEVPAPAAEGGTPAPQPPVAEAPEATPPAAQAPAPTPPAGNAAPAEGNAPPAGGTAPAPAPATK